MIIPLRSPILINAIYKSVHFVPPLSLFVVLLRVGLFSTSFRLSLLCFPQTLRRAVGNQAHRERQHRLTWQEANKVRKKGREEKNGRWAGEDAQRGRIRNPLLKRLQALPPKKKTWGPILQKRLLP